jgi:tetratricopeptide (TPR) repeat protein
MKRLIIAVMLASACCLHGAGVKVGKQRLRELVVVPKIDLTSNYPLYPSRAEFVEDHLVPTEIGRLQKEIKEHPGDAERLSRLAALLVRNGAMGEARAYSKQAEEAAREKSDARSNDGPTLTSLADALYNLGKIPEAESVYRKATMVSSNEWKCWVGLGKFLGDQACSVLMPESQPGPISFDGSVPALASSQLPEALAKAESMRKESEKCFDRAISLSPKDADAFLARARVQMEYNITDSLLHYYRDRQPLKPDDMQRIYYGAAVVRYLKQAAALCPDDARIISLAAEYVILSEFSALKGQPEDGWKALPEKAQDYIRESISRLETLSENRDPSRAAGACEGLGAVKIMMDDNTGAKAAFRRAFVLEPTRQKAGEMWLGAAVKSGAAPEELASICQLLLKNRNSARNHLLMAKALIKQNKLDEAADHVRRAAKMEPDNLLVHLFGGAVALKSGIDEQQISIATQEMTRANDLLAKTPNDAERETRWREFMLNGAILCGLLDKPDDAKVWIDSVLKEIPDDETAKEIRSAIQ